MNPRFPRPFENELIWSAVARYSRRIGRSKGSFLPITLLGRMGRRFDPLLPGHLQSLSEALPSEFQLVPAAIRDNHTLFRVAAAGLPVAQANRLSEMMVMDRPYGRVTYLFRNHLGAHRYCRLKYCPECRETDLQRFGEAGWRAPHQIPGVACCHIHKCALIETPVTASAAVPVPLDQIDLQGNRMPQDPFALQYAEEAYQLFSYRGVFPPTGCIVLALALQVAVPDRANSLLKPIKRITQMVIAGLPSVAAVMTPLFEEPSSAIVAALHVQHRALSPLALLSAAVVTGSTLQEILSVAATLRHDERPPFACANPASSCAGQNTIWRMLLDWSHNPRRALFRCPKCGYSYSRLLPLQRTGPGNLDFEWTPLRRRRVTSDEAAENLMKVESRREEYLSLAAKNPNDLDAGQRKRLRKLRDTMLRRDRDWLGRHSKIRDQLVQGSRNRASHTLKRMARERKMLRRLDEISGSLALMRSDNQPRLTYSRIVNKLREFAPLAPKDLQEMPELHRRLHREAESRATFARRKSMNAPENPGGESPLSSTPLVPEARRARSI
jgi:hypothetical protein